jgi:ribosomal protein S18 acetylase RimI-like enzyme
MIRPLFPAESYPWELLLDADPEKEVVDRYIHESEILVYEKEQIVGVIVYQLQEEGWEIMNVAVAPNHQNQGIGKQLVAAALDAIHANQGTEAQSVIIKTGSLPSAALSLYKKMGFVEKEIVKNYFVDHYKEPIYENGIQLLDQLVLEKNI